MSSTLADGTSHISSVFRGASVSQIAAAIIGILTIRWVSTAIYRIYFHPLSRFPGPTFCAISNLPKAWSQWNGTTHTTVRKHHETYGDVVRLSPDEISFVDPQAWKDIYGHATKANQGAMPHKHWTRYGTSTNGSYTLLNAPDAEHTRMRRIFSPAFSDRALKLQEPLFMKYVDLLVSKLKEGINADPDKKFDMVRNYNFTTFDVMGDLTFGEPLHMLDNAEYDPWVSIIFGSVKLGSRVGVLFNWPVLYKLFIAVRPNSIAKKRLDHFRYAVERVTRRLERGRQSSGVDIWDMVLKQEDGKGLTRDEMDSNASLFMIAGTETTATLVSGLTYLLLKNPESMTKLVHEIRGAFATSADMHMEAVAALPYLNACMKEALRLYPPVASGLPRLTPTAGSTICGEYIPGGYTVAIHHLPMYTSSRNFKDPLSFIPERWTGDERFADDKKACLQPFSVGNRDCVGKNMAYHEMRLIITKVLYNFDFELCPESANWSDQKTYALWEKHPLMCKLKAVN